MEGSIVKNIVLGFVAGAIAFATAHEAIGLWLLNSGMSDRVPWSMQPSVATGLPELASGALWGGLWGAIFALILGSAPEGSMTFRGLLLGLFGPAFLGAFVIVPALTGEPILLGNDPAKLLPVLIAAGGFGAVTAWLYGFFTSGCRLP